MKLMHNNNHSICKINVFRLPVSVQSMRNVLQINYGCANTLAPASCISHNLPICQECGFEVQCVVH